MTLLYSLISSIKLDDEKETDLFTSTRLNNLINACTMRQTSIDYFLALGLKKQQIIQEELVKPEPRFTTLDDLIPFYERDYRVSQLNELTLFIDQRSVVLNIGIFLY